MQHEQQQNATDGNRNKLFAGLTKKLVSLEQEVSEKDAQLRAYQSRDASMTLELHNTTLALGQERSLLSLANSTISKLESKMQEILPQFEYHLEQKRQVASLQEQLSISSASLEDMRFKCEKLAIWKEEQTALDGSRSVSDREMLGTLIREVQSERTRAEQTRTRILEQVAASVYNKKQRVLIVDIFKRWKHDIRFYHKYNLVYFKSAESHGMCLLRTVMQNWRSIWPVGKYLCSSSTIRRLSPLLHSECRHGQERRCLSLRLLRNSGIAKMAFRMWKRFADDTQTIGDVQMQRSSGSFSNAYMNSEGSARKLKQIDSSKFGVLILNLRVKYALKRLLLVWHYEANIEEKSKRVSEIENDAKQARLQFSGEMQMLEAQRKSFEGEIEKIRTRSHTLVQKTVETLFGSNTRVMLQSSFNKLKNCALEARSLKIEELQQSLLHVGENTAFKLLQYETAITMARDYCIRRFLPEIAFLTWKKATVVVQSTHEADALNARIAELESSRETQGRMQNSLAEASVMDVEGNHDQQPNRRFQNSRVSPKETVHLDRTLERLDGSASTQNRGDRSQQNSTKHRHIQEFAGERTLHEISSQNQGQHQTLSQLASFLMPPAIEQSISSSPLMEMYRATPKSTFEDMIPDHSSLIDLQQKLSRLESRWASIRLSTS